MTELRKAQMREAARTYRARHPDRVKSALKGWREKNRGYSTQWYRDNLEKARNGEKSRSKTEEYKTRKAAQQRVRTAVRTGRLVKPSTCSKCGKSDSPIHGHHPNYSEPLTVKWLCKGCHVEVHYH